MGGVGQIKTSARVIAATNRNLEEALTKGEFREDLYYRLNVFPLTMPSLCEHREDIPDLVDFFFLRFHHCAGISDGVMQRLMEYAWPGNVRELENCIERGVIMAAGRKLELAHLPEHIRSNRSLGAPTIFKLPAEGISLDELEKNMVLQALDLAAGNKTRAASLLGISRRALYSRMNTHGLRGAEAEEA